MVGFLELALKSHIKKLAGFFLCRSQCILHDSYLHVSKHSVGLSWMAAAMFF